jgi:hypothetical protein
LATKENSQNIFQMNYNPMVYKFYLAFMNSELDYFKFYKILPEKEVYALLGQQRVYPENLP